MMSTSWNRSLFPPQEVDRCRRLDCLLLAASEERSGAPAPQVDHRRSELPLVLPARTPSDSNGPLIYETSAWRVMLKVGGCVCLPSFTCVKAYVSGSAHSPRRKTVCEEGRLAIAGVERANPSTHQA